jgi:uncharacterized low-complexity protein
MKNLIYSLAVLSLFTLSACTETNSTATENSIKNSTNNKCGKDMKCGAGKCGKDMKPTKKCGAGKCGK